jgi:BTB/POZ domain
MRPRMMKQSSVWKGELRNKLHDDRFHDVTILCSDGESVRCQSFMLRATSGIFDEMLGCNEAGMPTVTTLEAPKFPYSVMANVKRYCHLGELINHGSSDKGALQSIEDEAEEVKVMMETAIAADYYNLDELGRMCSACIKDMLEEEPNRSFLVAGYFGLDHSSENRDVVKSIIIAARRQLCRFQAYQMTFSSVAFAAAVQDRATLCKIVDLLPFKASCPLIKFQFLENWMVASCQKYQESASEIESLARDVVKELQLLKQIGRSYPHHLVAKDGLLRASDLVDSEAVMDAIYDSSLERELRQHKEADKVDGEVVVWC